MALIADVADWSALCRGDLALEGEHVVADVGHAVAVVEERVGGDGKEVRPVDRVVRIGCARRCAMERETGSAARY